MQRVLYSLVSVFTVGLLKEAKNCVWRQRWGLDDLERDVCESVGCANRSLVKDRCLELPSSPIHNQR